MSVEQLEQSVRALPVAERRRFLDWLLAHEAELRGEPEALADAAWRQETRRRVAEIESGAVAGIPGELVSERIRRLVGR